MKQPLVRLADYAKHGLSALRSQSENGPSRFENPVGVAKAQTQPRGRTVKPVRGSMNGLESRYAKHLDWQIREGQIAAYWFEQFKVRLADLTWYTPDFLVQMPDGTLEWRETKGWMRDDANIKVKVTSELYWQFPIRVVQEKRGVFTVREVGR